MDSRKPLILISNDDGYHAVGIRSLVSMVKDLGQILVCAPESGRSGFSRAFSATSPLRIKQRNTMGDDVELWSCSGTPVDCIKLAVDQLCEGRKPDLVLAGINHGDNSTVNSHYSGTMGVVIEGCLKGIPSIAFSNCNPITDADQSHLTTYVRTVVAKVLAEGLPHGVCLNVNFPNRQSFEGVKACRMTFGQWVKEVDKRQHPYGGDYYWLTGYLQNEEPDAEDTDQWALNHGYVAITPTTIDLTAYNMIETINNWHL